MVVSLYKICLFSLCANRSCCYLYDAGPLGPVVHPVLWQGPEWPQPRPQGQHHVSIAGGQTVGGPGGQEAGDRRQGPGGRRQETGGRRQEAGARKQEAGGRRQYLRVAMAALLPW